MLMRTFFVTLLVLFLASAALAQGSGFGIGVMIGTPTGITAKAWVERSSALQLNVGWPSLDNTNGTLLTADYVWHSHVFRSRATLPLFYGLGGTVGLSSGSNTFGVRLVGGIEWWPHGTSLDVFLQIAPTFYFKPSSKFDVDPGFGIRFFL